MKSVGPSTNALALPTATLKQRQRSKNRPWTPAELNALIALANEGKTASAIREALGQQFGHKEDERTLNSVALKISALRRGSSAFWSFF